MISTSWAPFFTRLSWHWYQEGGGNFKVESAKRSSDAPGEKLIRLSWELLLENCLVMRKSTFFSLRKIGCITVGACILEDDLVKNTNKFFCLLSSTLKSHPIALKCLFFKKLSFSFVDFQGEFERCCRLFHTWIEVQLEWKRL